MEIIFYNKEKSINFLKNSDEFINYIKNTDELTFKEKTGVKEGRIRTKISNIENYLYLIRDFSKKEKDYVTNIINSLPKQPMILNKWIFIKVSDRLEKGWPFTIEDTIVITNKFLRGSSIEELRYTLSHEKIHNLQWMYPNYFYSIYKLYGFDTIPVSNLNRVVIYSNPDGLQTSNNSWFYNYKNLYLVPVMTYHDNTIKKESLPIKIDYKRQIGSLYSNDSYKTEPILTKIFPECDRSQCYHPHEIFADLGARYILNGHLKTKLINNFFNDLSEFIFQTVL